MTQMRSDRQVRLFPSLVEVLSHSFALRGILLTKTWRLVSINDFFIAFIRPKTESTCFKEQRILGCCVSSLSAADALQ